jgi:iron complex outermembrane receptor protein
MVSIRNTSAVAAAVALGLGGTASAPALAQGALMDDVVVTAQRREEVAQDVPLAITAYTADQLERLQVTETLDMTRLVPNFIGHNNTGLGSANTYSIRGLNNTETIATFDPPVGSYVDDIYVTRQNANNFTLFDVDRIEVLRGPQGTLFGRNTTGGAVRVILKKPQEELGGYISGGFGEFSRVDLRGSIDVPITENFLTKVSAFYVEDDGFSDNRTTGETINRQEGYGIRGHALWKITDALTWDVAVDAIKDDHINILNFKDGGKRVSNTGLSQENGNLSGLNIFGEKRFYPLQNETESLNLSSVIDWDIGDIGTLSFITGWRDLEQRFALDFFDGPPPTGIFVITNDGKHEQFTQEIKWTGDFGDSVQYVAGLFYIKEENTTDFADVLTFGPPFVALDRTLQNDTEALAGYLQADINFADAWTFTAGVRYTDEEKTAAIQSNPNLPCDPNIDNTCLSTANVVAAGIPTKITEKIWTPRFALNFQASDTASLYVSATNGFKSGGWNARAASAQLFTSFGTEEVWSYEAGLKSEWLDNTVRFNVNLFFTDATDYQLPSGFEDPNNPGVIVFNTNNSADLENKGVEVEVVWAPNDQLTLFANGGLQDPKYTNISQAFLDQQQDCLNGIDVGQTCGTGIVDLDGNIAEPVRAPEYTLNLGFNYIWPITSSLELVPSAYTYTVGPHNVGTAGLPIGLVDGYTTWNGSIALNNVDQDWSLTAGCKNCNDRLMTVSVLAAQPYFQDPRTWMITFRKNFAN